MSEIRKREFKEFSGAYFTLIPNEVGNDFTAGRVFEATPTVSHFSVVPRNDLEDFLKEKFFNPNFLQDDDNYNCKLCEINLLSDVTEVESKLTVTKFELVASFDLNIQTLVDLGINEITMLFNILSYAACCDRSDDFQIWLNSENLEFHPRSLNNEKYKDKQHLYNAIRMFIVVAVNKKCQSLKILELLYSCPIIYEKFCENIMYYASVLGSVKVLDWFYNFAKKNNLQILYDHHCIDGCCKHGHVKVLQWWFTKALCNKNIKLLYTSQAMDSATLYAKTDILQCWYNNREALNVNGYELLYTEEGFDVMKNINKNSTFEKTDVQKKYGSFLFNRYRDMCYEPLGDNISDYFTLDYCVDVLWFSIKWWSDKFNESINNNFHFPIKYSLNTLKQTFLSESIENLDGFVSLPGFEFKKMCIELPKEEFYEYMTSIFDVIATECKFNKKSLYRWWLKFCSEIISIVDNNTENDLKLRELEKNKHTASEKYGSPDLNLYFDKVDISNYKVGPTYYDGDDERSDLDLIWKTFA